MKSRTLMRYTNSIQKQSRTFAMALAVIATTCTLNSASQAEVVFHKTNIKIYESTYNLDLNGDGIVDFMITSDLDFYFECNGDGAVTEVSSSNNGTLLGPLNQGDMIGPDQVFVTSGTLESFVEQDIGGVCFKLSPLGSWVGVTSGFLGFSLQSQGQTYYGWAKLINKGVFTDTVVLVGYAYQDTPGIAIAAGQKK